jgi:hypothetical protein
MLSRCLDLAAQQVESRTSDGQGTSQGGVWGSSGSDVFAVGSNGTILHYDGSSWSSMTSGTSAWLFGVGGSSGSGAPSCITRQAAALSCSCRWC